MEGDIWGNYIENGEVEGKGGLYEVLMELKERRNVRSRGKELDVGEGGFVGGLESWV